VTSFLVCTSNDWAVNVVCRALAVLLHFDLLDLNFSINEKSSVGKYVDDIFSLS
jgi:hypothetical protein